MRARACACAAMGCRHSCQAERTRGRAAGVARTPKVHAGLRSMRLRHTLSAHTHTPRARAPLPRRTCPAQSHPRGARCVCGRGRHHGHWAAGASLPLATLWTGACSAAVQHAVPQCTLHHCNAHCAPPQAANAFGDDRLQCRSAAHSATTPCTPHTLQCSLHPPPHTHRRPTHLATTGCCWSGTSRGQGTWRCRCARAHSVRRTHGRACVLAALQGSRCPCACCHWACAAAARFTPQPGGSRSAP